MASKGRRAGSFREPMDMLVSRVGDPLEEGSSPGDRTAGERKSKPASDANEEDVHARLFERAWRNGRD